MPYPKRLVNPSKTTPTNCKILRIPSGTSNWPGVPTTTFLLQDAPSVYLEKFMGSYSPRFSRAEMLCFFNFASNIAVLSSKHKSDLTPSSCVRRRCDCRIHFLCNVDSQLRRQLTRGRDEGRSARKLFSREDGLGLLPMLAFCND